MQRHSTPEVTSRGLSAEICTVGTELLLGETVDTNAVYLAQQLARIGVDVFYRSGVGDNLPRVCETIRTALSRSNAVILTGGLGPTLDDLTAEAIARVFDVPLHLDAPTVEKIRTRIERQGLKVADSTYRQARVPDGAIPLRNEVGQAPGIWIERDGKLAIALPGVPSEMKDMMIREVIPRLQTLTAQSSSVIRSRVLRMVGITESLAEERIIDLIRAQANPSIAPYAGSGEVRLRLTARAPNELAAANLLDEIELRVRQRLGEFIYGSDSDTLQDVVGRLLLERHLTIATAESCTAGMIAAALTEMPGSSGYLVGGEVVYSNESKIKMLGVPRETIDSAGAVSRETAAAMATGARLLHDVDIGVAVTGIAGPGGGTDAKPVGLVFLGMATHDAIHIERRVFGGDRSTIRKRTVTAALQMLQQFLRQISG